jgi:hypothetical protein
LLRSSGKRLEGVDFLISKPFLLENLRQAIAKVAPPQTSASAPAANLERDEPDS